MSGDNLHLHFSHQEGTFDFTLSTKSKSAESVVIDGRIYSLEGTDCNRLKAMVPELTSKEGIGSLELKERLWSLKARNIKLIDEASAVAFGSLGRYCASRHILCW